MDQKAQDLGDYLAGKLQKLTRYGVVREVRGKGLLLGVELVKDTETMAPYPELGQALKRTTLQNGLILRTDPSWFAVAPALISTESDAHRPNWRLSESKNTTPLGVFTNRSG